MASKFTPHDYQRHCIMACIEKPNIALWLGCGLGKTIITLTALQQLKYNYFTARKILIIAPKKVSEATWQREAEKWEHLNLRISTVLGTVNQRINALAAPADIYVINRDNIVWLVDYYKNAWDFDTVVLDESSSFKNGKAKRTQALINVRGRIKRMIQLTGTPAPKDALDTWAQVYLLDQGERLGKSIEECQYRYFMAGSKAMTSTRGGFKQLKTTSWVFQSKTMEAKFYSSLNDLCISLKAEDYISMPALTVQDMPIKLDKKAQKAYDTFARDQVLEFIATNEVIDAGSAASLRIKLLQVGNGACYDEDKNVVEVHNNKIEALMELLEKIGEENALIFYAFKHDRDRILEALAKNRNTKGKTATVFQGAETEEHWNSGQINYLLAHPASCAYGLNIQDGGRHIIWFGLTDSLELYQQANARLYRQGQKLPVIIHRILIEGGVDEDVAIALEGKADVQDELLVRTAARIEKYRKEEKL